MNIEGPSILTNPRRITPHIPYYLQDASHSHQYQWQDFVDKLGNCARIKIVKYLTKKNQEREAVIQVVWRNTK